MRSWELAVSLDPDADLPIFLQIARAIASDIRRGRLRAGDPLPSSRALARSLSVHRNTVLAAYSELFSEGWIETRPAQGTRVSAVIPERQPRRFTRAAEARTTVPARLGFDLGASPEPYLPTAHAPGTLVLSGGVPDLRLLPKGALARALRRALLRDPCLDYGDPRGHPRLRRALSGMLSSLRGLAASEDNVLVTRGSQMALDLAARALITPGSVVAVESFGYRPAWEALRAAGASLTPIPVDAHGLRVDALAALVAQRRIRAVYVTPHHQYPTTALLAPGRRLELLELARVHRIAILEDDYDHEFHYDGRPILPLASADRAGVVVYIGTLSKILAPGLRLGFIVAPEPLVARLSSHRMFVDRQGDHTLERAVAELLEDGEIQRHARRARRIYHERRDALVEALNEHLGGALSFTLPPGGMAIWARAAPGIDVDAWSIRSLARKVAFYTACRFSFDGRKRPYVRLGFAPIEAHLFREAARNMAAALSG